MHIDRKKEGRKKRYSVCAFPSLLGTPVETNWWIIARFTAWLRSRSGYMEVRIIDNSTGKHYVL